MSHTLGSGLFSAQGRNPGSLTSDEWYYLGDPDTDGTWRYGRNGDDVIWQRRVSGSYVEMNRIEA